MEKISDMLAVEKARVVRPLTEIIERECVAGLAEKVPNLGTIVEIGCLYGGMTAVLGLAAKNSVKIISIDDFSWHPADDVPTSKELLLANMEKVGVHNVEVIEGDSRIVGPTWEIPIHLLWVDGGHSFEYVRADLFNFGPHAQVIALHDYDNPHWPDIKQAVDAFLQANNETFYLASVTGTVAVLRRW